MPRKSSASLAIATSNPMFNGDIDPPSTLSKSEAALFRHTVRTAGPKHFRSIDTVLLARYCEAAVLAEEAAQHLREEGAVVNGKVNPYVIIQEKCVHALTALSGKLRIGPLGRTDPKVIARNNLAPGPWYLDRGNSDE